jgi:hypothetical protein
MSVLFLSKMLIRFTLGRNISLNVMILQNTNYMILAEIPGVARDSITNIHVLFLIRTVT